MYGMKLSEVNLLQNFVLTIDDTTIPATEVKDFSMSRSIDDYSVYAELTISDGYDFSNDIPIDGTNLITVIAKDQFDDEITEEFKILYITPIRRGNANFLTLNLVDVSSYEFNNMYKSKGFKEKSTPEIIEEYIKLLSTPVDVEIGASQSEKKFTMTTPQDRPVSKVIADLAAKDDSYVVRKRDKYMIGNLSEQFDDKAETYYKSFAGDEEWNKIFDMTESVLNPYDMLMVTPTQKTFYYDPETKSNEPKDYDLTQAFTDFGSSKTPYKIQDTDGEKYNFVINSDHEEKISKMYQRNSLKTLEINIIVNGAFSVDLGTKVTVDIPANTIFADGDKTPRIFGEYNVIKITDKITSIHFTQRLTLAREFLEE